MEFAESQLQHYILDRCKRDPQTTSGQYFYAFKAPEYQKQSLTVTEGGLGMFLYQRSLVLILVYL